MAGAIDDLDPDGDGIEGDMRYDYELSRMRREHEKKMRENRDETKEED